MPIRWYGTSDQSDPLNAHFSRIVNFVLHAMGFAAVNSGLWLAQQIRHPWNNLNWFTEIWLLVLIGHFVFVVSKRPGKTDERISMSVNTGDEQ